MRRKAVWISCILTALFCGRSANARVILTLDQVGPNVVATGSGTVDTADLMLNNTTTTSADIFPALGILLVGASTPADFYSVSPFFSFGSGSGGFASSAIGDFFGTRLGFGRLSSGTIAVPADYVSGMFLSGTATWDNTTIAALGATPGTYTLTWGEGAHADSLRLIVTPEPSTLGLLGTGLISLAAMVRRKLKLRT
jgi:hypothetical protein